MCLVLFLATPVSLVPLGGKKWQKMGKIAKKHKKGGAILATMLQIPTLLFCPAFIYVLESDAPTIGCSAG